MKSAHGGKRAGAGKKKGTLWPSTITKEAIRAQVQARVAADLDPLIEAQLANAKGISHFFLRDTAGQFVKIEDPKLIAQALNSGDEGKYYYIFTKDPSIQAFTDLMNRAADKPAEQIQEIKLTGELSIVNRLHAARAKHAKRR